MIILKHWSSNALVAIIIINLDQVKMYPYKRGGMYGAVSLEGHFLLDRDFLFLNPFEGVLGSGMLKNKNLCVILDGQVRELDRSLEIIHRPSEGLMLVQDSEYNFGFVDETAKMVIPCIYERAHAFCAGKASVRKNGFWGCVSREGDTVVHFSFDYLTEFTKWGVIGQEGCWCFLNEDLAKFDFKNAGSVSWLQQGVMIVSEKKNRFRVVTTELLEIAEFSFDDMRGLSDGVFAVRKGRDWFFVDERCVVMSDIYADLGDRVAGVAPARCRDSMMWGAIDVSGAWIIEPSFDMVLNMDGQVLMCWKGKYILDEGESFLFRIDGTRII